MSFKFYRSYEDVKITEYFMKNHNAENLKKETNNPILRYTNTTDLRNINLHLLGFNYIFNSFIKTMIRLHNSQKVR